MAQLLYGGGDFVFIAAHASVPEVSGV